MYYDTKTKSVLKTKAKYYSGDIGLINTQLGFENKSSLSVCLENVVYLELFRRGYKVYT
jgi:predicted AAA+ superfamily ATPase